MGFANFGFANFGFANFSEMDHEGHQNSLSSLEAINPKTTSQCHVPGGVIVHNHYTYIPKPCCDDSTHIKREGCQGKADGKSSGEEVQVT